MPEPKTESPHRTALFTPGPLNVSDRVRSAMSRDVGSRSEEFVEVVAEVRRRLLEVAGLPSCEYSCVPMAGSGTSALEAALATAIGRDLGCKKVQALIVSNGAYGERLAEVCAKAEFRHAILRFPETEAIDPDVVAGWLKAHGTAISLVALVHCETSTGLMNPLDAVVEEVRSVSEAWVLVDAMSSLGAVPFAQAPDILVTSSNKCLQGVPGLGLVLMRRDVLEECEGRCPSLTLDLAAQAKELDATGQFRFTPPTHAVLALREALAELAEEGGVQARKSRYQSANRRLRDGMRDLGFRELLEGEPAEGWIITSFRCPDDASFDFDRFRKGLSKRGLIIYPGKSWVEVCSVQVTKVTTFRIGNIGDLHDEDFDRLLSAVPQVLTDIGVKLPLDSVEQTRL